MNILMLVLAEINKAQAQQYISNFYPDGKVNILFKSEMDDKPFPEKVQLFRKNSYDLALVLSDDLQYQTKVKLLKGILLFVKARERKIVDDADNEIRVDAWDFVTKSIPALIAEFLLSILGLLFSFIFLNILFIYLKIRRKKTAYESSGSYFAYLQSTFAAKSFGGGEPSAWTGVADGITGLGYKIRFITSSPAQFEEMDYPVDVIKPTKTFESLYDIQKLMHNYRFIRKAYRLFSQNKPDALIQYNGIYDFSGAVLSILLKRPLFIDTHDVSHWELSFWHKIQLKYFAKLTENISFSGSDAIFTVSQDLKDIIDKRVESEKVIVRPNGVNAEKFKPLGKGEKIRKKYGIKAEVVVGYTGSFSTIHGMDILVRAIETIAKKNENIHFLLVGEGGIYVDINDFVHQRKLGRYVTLTGNVSLKQVPIYLDACDILIAIYTNADFHNSPIKIFEYMSMGKVVVASSKGQISSIIDNGKDGLLIERVDEESLTEAILLLSKDKKLRTKMGKAARKKILEKHTWEATTRKITDVYQGLIANNI